MAKIEAVDLFCGVGGLTRGLEDAGIVVRAGFDIDPVCEYPYSINNTAVFIQKSVSELTGKEVNKWFHPKSIRLLAGCAPCQPFSTMANTAIKDKKKWGLLGEFGRLIQEIKPELVTMENVPGVTKHAPYQNFIKILKELGYYLDARSVRCKNFEIAQERKRFVLVASRLGEISLPIADSGTTVTVRDVISHLPKLSAGETDINDPMHKARSLSEINLKRIRSSSPGGTWRDWSPELRSPCHQVASGATYSSVYARMSWDKPSPTITTQCYNFGSGRFGHPEQDRAISLREAAILQSFPISYRFVEDGCPVHFNNVGRMIGNAVPPKLGLMVGNIFLKHLENYYAK